MTALAFILIAWFMGALPFSVLLGQIFFHFDVRNFGEDANPGTANAWKAGGWKLGVSVLLLDFLKGALPVGLAQYAYDVDGWALAAVALAAVLGHVFSPFLHFKGGKGLTVTFGVWTGLTLWVGPSILGIFFTLFYFLITPGAWVVVFSMLAFLAILLLSKAEIVVIALWAANFAVLVWAHRKELRRPARPRILGGHPA